MKTRLATPTFLLFASAVLASPVQAQDASGEWEVKWENETPRGVVARTMLVTLEQSGATLTGSAQPQARSGRGQAERGGDRPGNREGGPPPIEVADGTVEGGRVTFSLSLGRGDRTMTQTFTGRLDGNRITGTISTPRGDVPFTAERKSRES